MTIPLLSSVHSSAVKANWKNKRPILASFVGQLTVHSVRQLMVEYLGNKFPIEGGKYKDTDDTDKFDYLMLNSTFALCPRGYGNTSYRLVEAMQYGAIPVYISDVFSLPYTDVIDWNKICIVVTPNEIEGLYERLNAITQQQIYEYRQNIKDVYEDYFTMNGCCKNILRYVQIC